MSGIRARAGGWQVRVYPFPAKNVPELIDAVLYRDKLRELKAQGIRELPELEPRSAKVKVIAFRFQQRELKRMKQEGLSQASLRALEYGLRPWLGTIAAVDGLGRSLAERTIAGLTAGDVDDYVRERALENPTTARDELAKLRSLVRYARDHGVEVDSRILDLKAPKITTRTGIALTYDELEYVASFAFEHAYRAILFTGTVGLRIMEALSAVDDWFDIEASTLTVPAEACKEGRTKVIVLTDEERSLLLAQQRARVTRLGEPRYLFPRSRGTGYGSESAWHNSVWLPTLRKAIRRHEVDHRCEPRFATWRRDEQGEYLFDWKGRRLVEGLQPHDLRRTAISLMREAGMPQEYVAARVGHIDDGKLALKTYRKVHLAEQERFLRGLGGGIGSALQAAAATDREASGEAR
jgi:integrase